MKKIKLKNNKKNNLNILVIVIVSLIISLIFCFNYIGKKVTPLIINYAEKRAKKIAVSVITKAVDEETYELEKNVFTEKDGQIEYDTVIISKLLKNISKNVRDYLKDLELGKIKDDAINYTNVDENKLKNGIIYEVPSGIIFNNGLLANIGPKIPVKLNLIGDIVTDIKTDIKEYGINNALIEISISVKVTEQVILPFSKNETQVDTNIPICIKLIKGEVPNYYANPYSLNSN